MRKLIRGEEEAAGSAGIFGPAVNEGSPGQLPELARISAARTHLERKFQGELNQSVLGTQRRLVKFSLQKVIRLLRITELAQQFFARCSRT
jgi:hypothetical protein